MRPALVIAAAIAVVWLPIGLAVSESEPNNTCADADNLFYEGDSLSGTVSTSDSDYARIALLKTESLDWEVWTSGGNGAIMGWSSSCPVSGGSSSGSIDASASNYYYGYVSRTFGATSFSYTAYTSVWHNDGGSGGDAPDILSSAYPITGSVEGALSMANGDRHLIHGFTTDVDFYRINMPVLSTLVVSSTTEHTQSDAQVTIFDPFGNELITVDAGTTVSCGTELAGGDYGIRIRTDPGWNHWSRSYRLTIVGAPLIPSVGCA